jgi:hypothetical protein
MNKIRIAGVQEKGIADARIWKFDDIRDPYGGQKYFVSK